MEESMDRGVVLAAALLLAGSVPIVTASAQQPLWGPVETRPAGVLPPRPLPPADHADIPSLPPGDSGFSRDPRTGQYTAENGQAIWVPGHNENGQWVEGRWMYQKPATEGYGR